MSDSTQSFGPVEQEAPVVLDEYEERRKKEVARVAPAIAAIAQAFNGSNIYAPFEGRRLYRMYASGQEAYLIADEDNYLVLTIQEATWSRYDAHPAVLTHAERLGHKPSDWYYAGELGRVSACALCGVMARIDNDGKDLCEPYTKPCIKKAGK